MATPRRTRRFGRWLGVLTVLLIVLFVTAGVVSQTATFRDWLRRAVLSRVNAGLAGELAIGSLDGNLYGQLVANDVRLVLDGQRVLAIRRLVATYDVLALMRGGGLRLTSMDADGVAVQLIEDERGWNVTRLSSEPPSEDAGALAVALEQIRITNAAVRVIRPRRVWRLRALTLAGSARFADEGSELAIAGLTFTEAGSGLRLVEGAGRMAFDPRTGLRADDVRLHTVGSELRLRGTIGSVNDRAVDVHFEIPHVAADELALLFGQRAPVSDFGGAVHATGPAAAVVVGGEFRARREIEGDVREVGVIGLDGTLDVSTENPGWELRATLAGVDLSGILGPETPESDLTGTVRVDSAATLPRTVGFEVELDEPRVGATTLTRFALTGTGNADEVGFDATATTASGSARASGTIGPTTERFDLRMTASELDLAPLTGRDELGGRLNGTAVLTGEGFAPITTRARVHATLAPSRLGGIAISAFELAGRADAGRLMVERATAVTNAGTANASGELALGPGGDPGAGGLQGEVRVSDLRPLAALLGQPGVSGAATLVVSAHGAPGAFQAKVTLSGRALAGSDWRVETLESELAAERLGAPDARADLRGRARNAVIADRRITDVDLEARWQGTATAGRGAIDLRVREADRQHQLAAEATAQDGARRVTITRFGVEHDGDTWVTTGTPVIVQRDDRFTIEDLVLRSARGSVRLRGVMARMGSNDLELVVDALDLRALGSLVPADVTGALVGRAHLGGTFAVPRLDADVAVEAPTLGGVRYRELGARIVADEGKVELHGRLAQDAERALLVDGSVPARFMLAPARFEVTGGLTGRLRAARLDLAFLGSLVPGLVTKTGGTLDAEVAIGGSLATPEASGTVAVSAGRAYVVPLGLTYDPIAIELRLEGQAASIERLTIQSGTGRVNGGGNARLAADGAVMDARFEAQAFPLFANEYGHGAASGWLWISGTLAAPVLEGSLATDRLVLRIPEVLPTAVHPADPTIVVVGPGAPAPVAPTSATPPSTPVPGLFERAAITVQLSVPQNAWVRRSDANIELQGWMTAWKKPGDALQLSGDIRGVRGWYSFQGKKFTLAEGSVRFSGQGLDPVLDIIATHATGDYLVRLRVGGTITRPSLKLESEPALDQADVLAVLLFGAPANRLSGEQSVGLREQALGIAGGYVAAELRQSVANALGVDDLQFDSGAAGLQDAKVSVGKYVAKDIFVSLAHRFGAQSGEEVRIEYRFRPGWSLETSTDTSGRSGVDVFWKRQY